MVYTTHFISSAQHINFISSVAIPIRNSPIPLLLLLVAPADNHRARHKRREHEHDKARSQHCVPGGRYPR